MLFIVRNVNVYDLLSEDFKGDKHLMNKPATKLNTVFMTVLYILSAALFIYGIYMTVYSLNYINIYQSSSAIAFESSFQYVVTSTVTYFGFAFLLFSGALCLRSLNKIQKSISTCSVPDKSHEETCDKLRNEMSEPEDTLETSLDMSRISFDRHFNEKYEPIYSENTDTVPTPLRENSRQATDMIEHESEFVESVEPEHVEPHFEHESETIFENTDAVQSENGNIFSAAEAEDDEITEAVTEIDFGNEVYSVQNTETANKTESEIEHEPVAYHERISSSVIKDIFENR